MDTNQTHLLKPSRLIKVVVVDNRQNQESQTETVGPVQINLLQNEQVQGNQVDIVLLKTGLIIHHRRDPALDQETDNISFTPYPFTKGMAK